MACGHYRGDWDNISAKEICCRAQQCCLGFKIEPSQVVPTHIFLIRIRCCQPSSCPVSTRKPIWDNAIRDLFPIKCWCEVARSRSNDGELPNAISCQSLPFELYASIKDLQAPEERERPFLAGCWVFGFSSSILKLETYPVCNFMDLARSE